MKEPNPREGQSDDLALRTYTLIFDAILQCESAKEQRRMISLFLCQAAILCRFLDGPQTFEDLVRKIRDVDIGSDWLLQVMQMH
ncbi:hypothetical protein ACM7D6_00365 [Pseudomonas aeruginosa]|uniref:hypothetical protein n=1 Tax=Pseudomonas aeruginosa TaxID=287 RepID=UPI00071C0861|nr:hypothetical protein [Pseudomonas aeruginosa]KSI13988.1 hypothetical protein AO984_16355 [Pseudomonas aeruginosa]MBH3725076.1 hypothetical protein [Pseudomonas aeruginosa]MBH3776555.1 hypothetical protein [Pseudomonas aeruginosa]MCF3988022.1 hypothetical protein [Pseudomonas aeruginosa]MCF3999778.1 hypothetical protein [Pseudomonas aeruginosa]